MTNEKILDKLKYFENYDYDDEVKIRFIENLYKLAHLSFDSYVKKVDKVKL